MICKLISDPHLSLQRLIVSVGLTRPDERRRGRIYHLITQRACSCSGRKPYGHNENSHFSHSFLYQGSSRCQQDACVHPTFPYNLSSSRRGPIAWGQRLVALPFCTLLPLFYCSFLRKLHREWLFFFPYSGVIFTLFCQQKQTQWQGE